ncbi:hypothetical protein [Companilactobacillus sp.]|uniref:hypothetical protein n=1 Tax=Companilactobacillus sp. TaxID=2767905 RepID=UPI002616DCA4|nr:hypothetical protein [Companilactobacillus sp.]
MDEITLSAVAVEKQHIDAICFYSGLGNGRGDAEYITRKHAVSLSDVKDAVDNAVTDAFYMKVNTELSPRRFTYGVYQNELVLVETCLLSLKVVEGFTPLNVRAASWRKHTQHPVTA